MIERQTVIDQIEVDRYSFVRVRFGLVLIEDGVEIDRKWHRTAIEPGGDVDAQIAAVNADITTRPTLRAPAFADDDKLKQLRAICQVVHTDDVVKQYHAASRLDSAANALPLSTQRR